ncbi:MAG: ParB domain protein nuclease [Ilumatobacteraceae bacterium]|nr:ParB domain protein nuclease [Ilumatobacteraceae bacterium]
MVDEHPFSLQSAEAAARDGELAPWVARFLASPGSDNADLARMLAERPDNWAGPVLIPLDQLHRLAGPPGAPVLAPVEEHEWRDDVADLAARVEEGWEPPPVIVTSKGDHFMVEDGNHRIEALRRAGTEEAWCIVNFADADELSRFQAASGT